MVINPVGSVYDTSFAHGKAAPSAPAPSPIAPPPADDKQLKEAIAAANESFASHGSSIEFSVDPQQGKTIVKVVDKSTGQLIRQIPSEEMIAIAQALDHFQGQLIRRKA
jgi:flagellar protein FlaG